MFAIVIVVLLSLHLVCVNLASAGPLLTIWCEWQGKKGNEAATKLGQQLAAAAIIALVVGGLIGVAIGALLWSDQYQAAWNRLPRRLFFGAWELVFSLLLMILHWWWWRRANPPERRWLLRALLPLLAGSNLLYHFPLLFIVFSHVAQAENQSGGTIDDQFVNLISSGDTPAQAVHVVIASLAVAGLTLSAMARPAAPDREDAQQVFVLGGRVALIATVLQFPIGIWLVMAQSPDLMQALTGSDMIASSLLVTSILLAFGLLHTLSMISFGDSHTNTLRLAIGIMLITILLMTGLIRRLESIKSGRSNGTRANRWMSNNEPDLVAESGLALPVSRVSAQPQPKQSRFWIHCQMSTDKPSLTEWPG